MRAGRSPVPLLVPAGVAVGAERIRGRGSDECGWRGTARLGEPRGSLSSNSGHGAESGSGRTLTADLGDAEVQEVAAQHEQQQRHARQRHVVGGLRGRAPRHHAAAARHRARAAPPRPEGCGRAELKIQDGNLQLRHEGLFCG